MTAKRYRCIRCRSRIDTDLHACPFCGEADALRYRRSRRRALMGALVVLAAVVASFWVALP